MNSTVLASMCCELVKVAGVGLELNGYHTAPEELHGPNADDDDKYDAKQQARVGTPYSNKVNEKHLMHSFYHSNSNKYHPMYDILTDQAYSPKGKQPDIRLTKEQFKPHLEEWKKRSAAWINPKNRDEVDAHNNFIRHADHLMDDPKVKFLRVECC